MLKMLVTKNPLVNKHRRLFALICLFPAMFLSHDKFHRIAGDLVYSQKIMRKSG